MMVINITNSDRASQDAPHASGRVSPRRRDSPASVFFSCAIRGVSRYKGTRIIARRRRWCHQAARHPQAPPGSRACRAGNQHARRPALAEDPMD